jgi:asparagine synthase (glutamine-hydrolysing)
MRRVFLALTWATRRQTAVAGAARLRRRLAADTTWQEAHSSPGLSIWRPAQGGLPVRQLGAGHVAVGDLFVSPGGSKLAFACGGPPLDAARRLLRESWGGYVALLRDAEADACAALRDPSGLVGCGHWTLDEDLHVVASDAAHVPPWLRPPRQALDWAAIAQFLAAPAVAMTASLFAGMEVVPPGGVQRVGAGSPAELVWNPVDFAANGHRDLAAAAGEILRRVDGCTDALLARHDRVLVELSGGLDSSIVSAAIGATDNIHRVAQWLNYRDGRPEADESRYARAVTDRLGVDLVTPQDWAVPIDEGNLAQTARGAWPAIGGADAGRDRHEVSALRREGATAIVSGQGGDGVFFQYPTALVVADALRRDGAAVLATPLLPAVARRTRQSVWSVLQQVRAARQGSARMPQMTSRLLSKAAGEIGAGAEHPWVRAARLAGLPPAKRLHVQGVAVTHLYGGPSRRAEIAEIVLPLFAQPVVELCLGLAAPDLSGESYDRPFARRAFAGRLPREVLQRRSKGDMSTYYGKLVASSLETLRPYLLDGCLAEAGLLDRGKLARTLEPEHLLRGGAGSAMDVANAAVVEAWVRYWQTQVPDSLTAGRWSWA